jgi:hypothetical protein
MTNEDKDDLKRILNEQFALITRLTEPSYLGRKHPEDYRIIYEDILDCNKVMMEIVCGPTEE